MENWKLFAISEGAVVGAFIATQMLGFRPPQWAGLTNDPAQLIYMRTNLSGYFFDAVLREEHDTELRITEHPIQTGANITDHAYKLPERLMLEIGMSDAMATLVEGQYTGGLSKSVNCYQTLKTLQARRTPLNVVTKLNSYQNMLIAHMSAPYDLRTCHGLRCAITLQQVILAKVQTTEAVTSRSQTTGETNKGPVQAEPTPNPSVARQIGDWIRNQ